MIGLPMKTQKSITLLLLSVLCFSLGACSIKESNASKKGEKTALTAKKNEPASHQDKRLAFEKIKVATAQEQFKGGTSIEELKELFGEPSSFEQKPAGNVTLDHYTWTFDRVSIEVNLFENSTIVKSITNFAFNRDLNISLKDYNKIKKGMSYNEVTKILTEPDDYSHASSSDKSQLQAIWVSGLKTKTRGSHISLLFENDQLIEMSQTGLID